MKKVLIIAHAFPPFQSVGHSIRVIKFIKYLPTLGWNPFVLTINDREEYEFNRKLGSESLLLELPQGISIKRTLTGEPSVNYLEKEEEFGKRNLATACLVKLIGGFRRWLFRNFALPDRCITWVPFAVHNGRLIIKKETIDIIFVTCPPHSATLIGVFLKLLTGKPLILDFRDDWIDTPWHKSKPIITQWIERITEKWVVKVADKIVLVTDWSKNAFIARYPSEPSDKFELIPNGCDLQEFNLLPAKHSTITKSRFTLVHAGSLNDSINWSRSPETLFTAIYNITQIYPDIKDKISLAFTGSIPTRLKKMKDDLGLSSIVHEVGFLPRNEWAQYLMDSDLLLVINYEGFSTLIPGKIYEYWAIGGPPILLLSCPGAASDFIYKHNIGYSVDPNDVDGIQKTILDVFNKFTSGKPIKISTDGIELYDRKYLTSKLARILTELA
jgi:glycosyltransferase involved in cell wall biosynthesis